MFNVGDAVRTRGKQVSGHTRLPRYLQRRRGHIAAVLGAFRFADEAATAGYDAREEQLYNVRFDVDGQTICADLFEPYLERDE